jgi:predicted nucleotide-binding protein
VRFVEPLPCSALLRGCYFVVFTDGAKLARLGTSLQDPPTLSEEQKVFVRRINEYFALTAKWPPEHDLRRQLVQSKEREVFAAGAELPDWYVLFHADARNGVALRVAAIWEAIGETRELQDFVSLLKLAAARYQQPGVAPILRDDELAAVGLSRDRLRYIDAMFEKNNFLSGPSGTADEFSYEVHSGIEPYLDVVNVPEFLRVLWRENYSSRPTGARRPVKEVEQDRRGVFVVHGRNAEAAAAMSDLLSAFGLDPQFFRDSLQLTGKATPSIPEVLDVALNRSYACVVVMTPDDIAQLRSEYIRSSDPDHERKPVGQARPNVLFEAGMSWARHGAARTVIVELGTLRPLTDLAGLHTVHFDGSPSARRELGSKLETAGCPVNWSARDWLRAGNFDDVVAALRPDPGPFSRDTGTNADAKSLAEVTIRSIGNLATEGCARWLHLEVATSSANIARAARISVVPPGKTDPEDWQWIGGLTSTDVRVQGARVPLVIGVVREPCTLAVGWPLTVGRWYLTPTAQSAVGREVGDFAPKARFQFQVIVSWDDGGVERRVVDTFELRLGRSSKSEPILIRAGDRPSLDNQMPVFASLRDRGVELRNQGMAIRTIRSFLMWKIVVEGWTEETREAIAAVSVKDANFWSTLDTYIPEVFPTVVPVTPEHLIQLQVLHEHIQRLARLMRDGAL